MNKDTLLALLRDYRIPLDQWGHGQAKTFEHLLTEITSGEIALVEKDGKLLRSVEGAIVLVYHDGRSRVRALDSSIGEKMKPGENPIHSAHRALSEELGIVEKLPLISRPQFVKGPVPSVSFPGLSTTYTMHVFDVFLPVHLYRREGYVERQTDKTSYFVWEESPDK